MLYSMAGMTTHLPIYGKISNEQTFRVTLLALTVHDGQLEGGLGIALHRSNTEQKQS